MRRATSGVYPSLAFDPADGNPAIAYCDITNGDLKLAWHDGSTWQTQTVDAVGNVGCTPSLAFNDYGSGFPSIAYFDNGSGGTGHCSSSTTRRPRARTGERDAVGRLGRNCFDRCMVRHRHQSPARAVRSKTSW